MSSVSSNGARPFCLATVGGNVQRDVASDLLPMPTEQPDLGRRKPTGHRHFSAGSSSSAYCRSPSSYA